MDSIVKGRVTSDIASTGLCSFQNITQFSAISQTVTNTICFPKCSNEFSFVYLTGFLVNHWINSTTLKLYRIALIRLFIFNSKLNCYYCFHWILIKVKAANDSENMTNQCDWCSWKLKPLPPPPKTRSSSKFRVFHCWSAVKEMQVMRDIFYCLAYQVLHFALEHFTTCIALAPAW